MQPGKIEGATRALGAPHGWDANGIDGDCYVLEIRDRGRAPNTMTSAWYPTEEEKQAIAAGRPVMLTVWGDVHPPVSINVPSA